MADSTFRFDFRSASAPPRRPRASTPFRILVLGDFGGRAVRLGAGAVAPRSADEIAACQPLRVDHDSFDDVLAKVQPRAEAFSNMKGPLGTLSAQPADLDGLHPDELFEDDFAQINALRRRLAGSSTFDSAVKQLHEWLDLSGRSGQGAAPSTASSTASSTAPSSGGGATTPDAHATSFEALLDRDASTDAVPAAKPAGVDIDGLVRKITGLNPDVPNPQASDYDELLVQAMGQRLRAWLRHPAYRPVELAWRSLRFLLERLDADSELSIELFDLAPQELAGDLLRAGDDLSKSGLWRAIVDPTVNTEGGRPFAVLCGLYRFGAGVDDLKQLACLAYLAQSAGAPFVGEAAPELTGRPAWRLEPGSEVAGVDPAMWAALRSLDAAAWLGLVGPRFLLRQPYGKGSDPIDGFDFAENHDGDPDGYLWAPGSVACTCSLGQSFRSRGWSMHSGADPEIDGLPHHVYERAGGNDVMPTAETYLTEQSAAAMIAQGVMPLLSVKGRDAAVFAAMNAVTGNALRGRWS